VKIHPTAIVDPGARLGEEVEIGPYALIGAEVEIGPHTIVQSHVVIEGAVRLGAANEIGHGAIIGGTAQDLGFEKGTKSSVEIGDRNVIREYVTIHRGTAADSATRIGHDNFLMAGAHLGHNCTLGDSVIIANNCLLGGYVEVDDGAFLGGGCVFHQFVRVGRLAVTQGGSAFSKDIPPFVAAADVNKVVGLNVVGLRRAGFSADERTKIKAAFRLLYENGLNVSQALAQASAQSWGAAAQSFFDFVASAKRRGICGLRRAGGKNDVG
jgi:UDP-N-acetylglucosamine acyltransferase